MSTPMTHSSLRERVAQEQKLVMALLTSFSDEQWHAAHRNDGWTIHEIVGHLSDANYGLSLMVLGEIPAAIPLNEQGQLDPSGINELGRQRNAGLSREKLMERLSKSFSHVSRAIDGSPDLNADGPYGASSTRGMWLERIINHNIEHRQELEALKS